MYSIARGKRFTASKVAETKTEKEKEGGRERESDKLLSRI